jgi:hypothetical protein
VLLEADSIETDRYGTVIDTVGALLVHFHDVAAGRMGARHLGERRLLAAIGEEAVLDLRRSPLRVVNAWNWIATPHQDGHLYSFPNVCALMGINVSAARTVLWNRYRERILTARWKLANEPPREDRRRKKQPPVDSTRAIA